MSERTDSPSGYIRDGLRVLLIVFILLISSTTGVNASLDAAPKTDRPEKLPTSPDVFYQQGTSDDSPPTANNTTRHQNPGRTVEQGNLSSVSASLASSLSGRLARSSITLSQDQYDLAREYVGDEYRQSLQQYVEVADQTPTDSDDRLADRFSRVSEDQRRLANQLERIDETSREYRQARRTGNSTRAEQLARELRRLADSADETRADIVEDYGVFSTQTSLDLSDEATRLNDTVRQRLVEVQSIQDLEFAVTTLEIRTTDEEGSFANPLELQGRLTSNGSAIASRDVRLEVGARSIEAQTDENGDFTIDYRPIAQRLGTRTIQVRFLPSNSSNFQTANASFRATITQTQPDVDVAVSPSEAGFNESVRVTGTVSVGNVPVPSAQISIFLDDRFVRTGETTSDGRINRSFRVPIEALEGSRPVSVSVGADDLSLAAARDTETLTVTAATALLSLNATRVNQTEDGAERRTVITQGRLVMNNGTPLSDQPLQILVGDVVVGTTTTDENGAYRATVVIPGQFLPTAVGGEERVDVSVLYSGEDTIFGETIQTSEILIQAELISVISRNVSVSQSLTALLLVGSAVALRRRYDRSTENIENRSSLPTSTDEVDDDSSSNSSSLLSLAGKMLDQGRPDLAVQFGYAAARSATGINDVHASGTHWEFYQRYDRLATSSNESSVQLKRLTELYERSAFDDRHTDPEVASEALSLAETMIGNVETEVTSG